MALDDAIAALEAERAAEAEAEALNRAGIDAASKRFAELAPQRLPMIGDVRWIVQLPGRKLTVYPDGSWEVNHPHYPAPDVSEVEHGMAVMWLDAAKS